MRTIRVTAFDWVPAFAQGQVRDLRVRWALEEAGLPYEAILLDQGTQGDPENLARQPFGQVPALEIDGRTLFESGAIVWRIAEESEALLPADPAARERVLCWLLASLNSVEPPVGALADLDFFVADEGVKAAQRPGALAAVQARLGQLQAALGKADALVDRFSAADLMMTSVLRILDHTDILAGFPALARYVERHTARPAFRKALADQMRPFRENAARYEAA
ncbi:glutathione S-transferase family protein [Aureimonas sp. AU12]|uniref:glutathione S-transferase family protein n=1 Tax=Aureimonas sp. AU12 TaxID=1638161 RepID=UPI0007830416|nr:glutathione S-transferase family protein [Aureimonas sp. AU12]